LEGDPTYHRI